MLIAILILSLINFVFAFIYAWFLWGTVGRRADGLEAAVLATTAFVKGQAEKIKVILDQPRQVLHLDLKSGIKVEGVEPTKLDINPSDFVVKSEQLREKLLDGLSTKQHPDTSVLAYCILRHAGLDDILMASSFQGAEKALTRLLLNGDDRKTKKFLTTLANSVK